MAGSAELIEKQVNCAAAARQLAQWIERCERSYGLQRVPFHHGIVRVVDEKSGTVSRSRIRAERVRPEV